ncbi:MAG: 5-deoxy-glucuronate isomerase [Propionibacteriaceae bacterium]|jgi:5-deoxy-glucuronate isomerase|nr:5-deoxy-glucuronate isomerase [Propionibacteriaceae bacterium]
MGKWHYPHGSTTSQGWTQVIDAQTPGWRHTGLRIGELAVGDSLRLAAEPVERIVLPLAGSFSVETAADTFQLTGRPSVWSGPTDLVYAGPDTALTISGTGQFAVCSAAATGHREAYHQPASATPVEFRGSGNMSREVRNFGTPGVCDAEAIIACEVLTPNGNWSSYPPHKHDQELTGVETELEEIYYFQLRTIPDHSPAPERCDPLGYQRVSASDDRSIDVLAEVRSGDVVLVPFGWHGPSMAAPGYDMYYLNVMAGPGRERAWRITDHPDQTWLRTIWPQQQLDPRLPFK